MGLQTVADPGQSQINGFLMSSGKLNIGLIDLYLSSCHNIKCGRLMDASNAVQYQAMALSVTIVSQSKVLEVPSLCLVFVNKCPCEII